MEDRPETDSGNVRRAERRLAARSRELDALQSLGRMAAQAATPEELFASAIAALHRNYELDLAVVDYSWDGESVEQLYQSRPLSDGFREQVIRRSRRFLGWPQQLDVVGDPQRLDGYDEARGERSRFEEEDIVLLPILCSGRPVACLTAVPSARADQQQLRLLYSASNQLSLHFDRLLRAREVETDRFRAIVNAMPQGVLLTDARLRILQANQSAERILADCGLDGSPTFEAGVEWLELGAQVERVLARQSDAEEAEARLDCDRVLAVTVSRLPGAGDPALHLLFVLSDVSESRRLQQQLAQSDKMSSLGQMISGVAHELNNPLASIVGYAQLVRGAAPEDEKLCKQLEVLGRESERCRKIVQNLLSFARRYEPERKPLSINQVVENVLSLLQYQLRVDGIDIERELDRELSAMEGDAHELEQVLVNLLTNAAHAIRETEQRGTVTVRSRGEDDRIVLEIHDTGPGIPEEARAKIFDPFFTTKAPGQGTGLGLSLVYGIVTRHGGTIEALAHAEPGTTFRIRLPAGLGGTAEPDEASGRVAAARGASGRVLVVDDDAAVGRLIREALVKQGHAVRCVQGGSEALERLAAEPFDLIVSDVRMPDMGGERLYDALCLDWPELARKVLWTTGDTLASGPEQLARRTGCELLTKPFDLAELCERVGRRLAEAD